MARPIVTPASKSTPEAATSLTSSCPAVQEDAADPSRRTKELTPEVRENFINFAKSLGLTDDHIVFTVPIGNGQCGLSRPAAVPPPPGERGAEEGPGPLLSH